MENVNSVNGIETYSTQAKKTTEIATTESKGIMDKDDFLMLFMESLKNQDPMDPMDNSAMMQQLSQLGQMEAVSNLQITVGKMQESMLGNKIAEAANLLGKLVVAINSAGEKVVGVPTAYRLNDGVVEYLVGKDIVKIGQIQEVGIPSDAPETGVGDKNPTVTEPATTPEKTEETKSE